MYFVYLRDVCSADSPLNPEKICAIRYLAGILELPKLWRLKTEERIDIGKRLFGFLSRLCETIFQLIQDTEPTDSGDSEETEDDSSPLWTSARSAVDILAFATLGGFLQLHGLDEGLPPCPSQLPNIVTFLIRYVLSGWKFSLFIFLEIPDPKCSFPKASGRALQVKEILSFPQNAGTNSLHVPPDAQSLLTAQFQVDRGPTENRRQEEEHEAQRKSGTIFSTRIGSIFSKSKKIIVYVYGFLDIH